MKKTFKGCVHGLLNTLAAGCASYASEPVRLVIDNKEITPADVNGNRVDAMIINGTAYLPVRAAANAFGKAVCWDGETSTIYLGNYNGNLPYPTVRLIDMNNIGSGWYKSNNLTDNYGNSYSNAIYAGSKCTAEYILNGKYSRLKGTAYIEKEENDDAVCSIVITADGKEIYTSPEITKTSRPIDIDVSVKGCNVLQIIRTGNFLPYIYIGNAGLYQ